MKVGNLMVMYRKFTRWAITPTGEIVLCFVGAAIGGILGSRLSLLLWIFFRKGGH